VSYGGFLNNSFLNDLDYIIHNYIDNVNHNVVTVFEDR
jgi:hypothetical protein